MTVGQLAPPAHSGICDKTIQSAGEVDELWLPQPPGGGADEGHRLVLPGQQAWPRPPGWTSLGQDKWFSIFGFISS